MEVTELKAIKRDIVGKETSKKLRRQGMVPAVIYHDGKARHIAINAREFSALTHSEAGIHVIVKLLLEGENKQPNAIIKEVQRNPIKNEYYHIDFQEIALDEEIKASLPIVVTGESPGVKLGGVIEHHLWEVEVEGLPKDMPDHIEADISNLNIDDSLHAGDLTLPGGLKLITDSSSVILKISAPQSEKVVSEAVESLAPEAETGAAKEAASAAEE